MISVLTQHDAVEPFGDDEVRRTRKEAVNTIEKELEELEARRANAWEKQSQPEVWASREAKLVKAGVGVEAGATTAVGPLAVPLPHGLDVEDGDDMNEAALEVFPNSEHFDAIALSMSTQSLCPSPWAFSTPSRLDLPPLSDSTILLASAIVLEL